MGLTEREPIICYNTQTSREAAVIVRVHDKNADNPQQSEEASHIGCNGTFPCQKCKWGGSKINQVQPAVYHACHEPGPVRTADEIRAELSHQPSLATRGSSAAIETRQKETGTKDKLTQYWIARTLDWVMQLKAESPGSSVDKIAKAAQHWLEEQLGDKINLLLDIVGLDPGRDAPVEILHTILLGVIKYIWHHLNTYKWTDNERHLLAIRLQSTDISGMNVPPIRGAYMMQYRNNLIGKHYKTIMQSLVFHVHGICNPDQFKLIKFAADLGAQLNIAIANLLDAWDAVEPLRILTKIKLHLLPHLPDDIRRFGPAVRFSTETQESYNAVFRMCSINGNNQAPSRDIAMKFAAMNNIKHAVCGGFWQSSAAYDSDQQLAIEAVRGWSEPGNTVKKLLFDDPVLQRHLGWVPHYPPVPGFVRLLGLNAFPPIPWQQTITSRHWTQEHPSQPIPNSAWQQGLSGAQRHWDELWKLFREAVAKHGYVFSSSCAHKHVIPEQGLTSYVVVPGTAVEFGCSVQHDCRRGNCKPAAMAKECQEREDTLRDISLIKHVDDDNFVLNLGSVHNFAELTRVLPRSLYNLKPQHSDRLQFHTEMAAKAGSARLSTREKTAEKRRATAARKKQKADEAAKKAHEAAVKARQAEEVVQGAQLEDLDDAQLVDVESDGKSAGEDDAEPKSESESEEDDDEYIPKHAGQKRGRPEKITPRQQKKRQKR
ncbi:hypothetical protein MIND_01285900 [Mycena indigotica]|uniref:Uncharacterized protein n=1 Tax=Mycena indigotica TaxID=2126181 RepID=A0A8H6S310_9AGAR|nr:uncharacterized protein MIND_01285900 [Mycena indigotica]KAF7291413.1 hypothetical protein MIND_01285900 [Mycena indigotica]